VSRRWRDNAPMSERMLRLQGAPNFRDLGGYPGRDGRPLRWRRLFRSDHLAHLTAEDLTRLQPLQIARAFDFRGIAERAAAPYELPGVMQYSLAIEPTVVQRMNDLAAAGMLSAPAVTELMHELYRALVNDRADRFAELFEHLLQSDAPAVLHCTAGKDRTGIAAALVLLALGVPRDVVQQDYLLTNDLLQGPPPAHAADTPADAWAVLWGVQQGFLDTALRIIDADNGGVERYLAQRLRLTPVALDALAARYLQAD